MKVVESPRGSSKKILEKTEDQGGISFQPQRFEALAEKVQHKRELPDELVKHFEKNFEKFVQEKDLIQIVLIILIILFQQAG